MFLKWRMCGQKAALYSNSAYSSVILSHSRYTVQHLAEVSDHLVNFLISQTVAFTVHSGFQHKVFVISDLWPQSAIRAADRWLGRGAYVTAVTKHCKCHVVITAQHFWATFFRRLSNGVFTPSTKACHMLYVQVKADCTRWRVTRPSANRNCL